MKIIMTDEVMDVAPGVMLFTSERLAEILEFARSGAEMPTAAQQHVRRTCAVCGADSWRDAICPDTLEICTVCGASR